MVRFVLLFMLAAIYLTCAFDSAGAIDPGVKAPPFELPRISGGGSVRSGDLHARYESVFLVFWQSGCPNCVEALIGCEEFEREFSGAEIAVIGVNSDSGDILHVREILDEAGITFEQLWDRTGAVSGGYDVPLGSITLYLLDDRGRVLARRFDPHGDMNEVMQNMYLGAGEAGAGDSAVDIPGGKRDSTISEEERALEGVQAYGFTFRGDVRLRWQSIDANGDAATGPYGEPAESRNALLYRFDLELSRPLGRHLTVGALLRISNEGEEVLLLGPDYFGAGWGSAFAQIDYSKFSFRLGYYSFNMTPLTLMRWDWDDNPRIGGDAGCGCGAAAGVLVIESLEELGPSLTIEGAVAEYRHSDFEGRLFYAIPRRAREVSYRAVNRLGEDPAHYSLEIYGLDWVWQRRSARTKSYYRAGVHLIGSWENSRSLDLEELEYPATFPWTQSWLISVTGEVPMTSFASLWGEWLAYNYAITHLPAEIDGTDSIEYRGGGGIAGVVLEGWRSILKFDYMRLEPEFYSTFAALSYEPNTEGLRFSTLLGIPQADVPLLEYLTGDGRIITFFYKRLHEVEVLEEGAERAQISFFGTSYDFDIPNGFGGSVGWLDRGEWRPGSISSEDTVRRALSLIGRYRFMKNSYIQLQYQHTKNNEIVRDLELHSTTDYYSIYFKGIF